MLSKIDLLNQEGKPIQVIELKKEVFGVKTQSDLLAQAVRVYLNNRRLGTTKVKTRGEVDKTTKKIYRQKHTGKARHGSTAAPIFVGGGVAHGPKPGRRSLTISKAMGKKALLMALSNKMEDQKVKVVSDLVVKDNKTKNAKRLLAKFSESRNNLLVLDKKNEPLERSLRNLPDWQTVLVENLNPYIVLRADQLLFLKTSLEKFEKVFSS